jgi:hypothetical protein
VPEKAVHVTQVKRANGGVQYVCNQGCAPGRVHQVRQHGNSADTAWAAARSQGDDHERQKNQA